MPPCRAKENDVEDIETWKRVQLRVSYKNKQNATIRLGAFLQGTRARVPAVVYIKNNMIIAIKDKRLHVQ